MIGGPIDTEERQRCGGDHQPRRRFGVGPLDSHDDNRNTLKPVDPPHLVRTPGRCGHGTTRSQTTFAIVLEGSRWPESADRRGAEQAVGEFAAFDHELLQRDVDMLVADDAGSFVGREERCATQKLADERGADALRAVPAAPASDNARLRHVAAVLGRGGRRRRAFM
jgi:hypothetical protein